MASNLKNLFNPKPNPPTHVSKKPPNQPKPPEQAPSAQKPCKVSQETYAPWHLPFQKTNHLLEIIGEVTPKAARSALQEPLDRMDLKTFTATLRAIEHVARAIARGRELLPYLRPVNAGLAEVVERGLADGALEDYDARQRFLKTVNIAWQARKGQMAGGLFDVEMKAKDAFLVGG